MAVAVRAARGLAFVLGVATAGFASMRIPAPPRSVLGEYMDAAQAGNPGARKTLAFMLMDGGVTRPDPLAAVEWLTVAAQAGDADAQAAMGDLYREGRTVKRNPEQAEHWYLRASLNSAYAAWRLGQMFEMGDGVPYDCTAALRFYSLSAGAGMAAAQNSLGNLFLGGVCVAQDYSQAHRWYTQAADQGYADALLNLAGMFLHGLGVPPSYEQAVTLAKRARSLHARDAESFLEEIDRVHRRAATPFGDSRKRQ
jgi:uncharacterized protein